MTRFLELPGLPPIEVRSQAECEQADFVVCCLRSKDPGAFTDNLVGSCTVCGREIVYRPHVPKTPPKICMECAFTPGRA